MEAIRKHDVELLEFAMQWLKFSLFHEKTMKLKLSGSQVPPRAAADVKQSLYYA